MDRSSRATSPPREVVYDFAGRIPQSTARERCPTACIKRKAPAHGSPARPEGPDWSPPSTSVLLASMTSDATPNAPASLDGTRFGASHLFRFSYINDSSHDLPKRGAQMRRRTSRIVTAVAPKNTATAAPPGVKMATTATTVAVQTATANTIVAISIAVLRSSGDISDWSAEARRIVRSQSVRQV